MLKENVIDFIKNNNKKYKNKNEFILALALFYNANYNEAKSIVDSLIDDGKIVEVFGKYKRVEDTEFVKGRVIGNNKGYAFVDVLDPNVPDYFIPPNKLGGAYNGDMVLIKPLGKTELSQEAEVVKVLERNNTTLVGTYTKLKKGDGMVTADNNKFTKQIFISKKNSMGAVSGQKVVVKVTFGKNDDTLNGEVIEILGDENSFNALELSIIRSHKLYEEFPDEVMAEANKVPSEVTEKDIQVFSQYPPLLVDISLYGSCEETYRKVTGISGAFEKVISNIKSLLAAGVRVSVKAPVLISY